MMDTPGYTSFEGMSSEPVKGAAGHDVFAIAMVLLRVCLKKEWRWPNLLTQPGLRTPEEAADRDALLARSNQGEAVALELAMWEFKMSRRTLEDRSFQRWVTRDKLDPALASADWLVELFPGLVSPDPEERDDMDFLSTIVGHLAEVNTRS